MDLGVYLIMKAEPPLQSLIPAAPPHSHASDSSHPQCKNKEDEDQKSVFSFQKIFAATSDWLIASSKPGTLALLLQVHWLKKEVTSSRSAGQAHDLALNKEFKMVRSYIDQGLSAIQDQVDDLESSQLERGVVINQEPMKEISQKMKQNVLGKLMRAINVETIAKNLGSSHIFENVEGMLPS